MEVEITLKCQEGTSGKLVLTNDEDASYAWLSIESGEQILSSCVLIEDLKLALRKLSTK